MQIQKPLNLADNIDVTKQRAELALKTEATLPLQDKRLALLISHWDKLPESLKDTFAAKAEIQGLPLAKFD